MNTQNDSQSLNHIEADHLGLRASIVSLDKKLKNLRAEIQEKLQDSLEKNSGFSKEYVEELSQGFKEVEDAIKGIDDLVKVVSTIEQDKRNNTLLQNEEIQELSQRIATTLEKMVEIEVDL